MYTLLQSVSVHFSLASILETVYQYLVPIPLPVTDRLLFCISGRERKCPRMNVAADIRTTCIQSGQTRYRPNYHVRLLFIYFINIFVHLSTGWSCNDYACALLHKLIGIFVKTSVIGDMDSVNFCGITGGLTDKGFISKTINAV